MSVFEVAATVDAFICRVLSDPKADWEHVDAAAALAKARMGMSAEQMKEWESLIERASQGNG